MHDIGLSPLPGRGSPQPPATAPLQLVRAMLPGPGHHFLPFRPSRFGLDLGGGVLGPLGTKAGSGVHTLVLLHIQTKPQAQPPPLANRYLQGQSQVSATPPSQHVYPDTHRHAPTITQRHTRNHTKYTATDAYITHTHTRHTNTHIHTQTCILKDTHAQSHKIHNHINTETHTPIYTITHTQPPTQT